MTNFEWGEALETSWKSIDERHRRSFEFANALKEIAGQDPADAAAITDAIYGLVGSIVESFREEEALMREHDYPGVDRHHALHTRLTADVLDFAAHYFYGEDLAPEQLSLLVGKWLRRHILRYDMRMAAFVEHAKSAQWAVEAPSAGS